MYIIYYIKYKILTNYNICDKVLFYTLNYHTAVMPKCYYYESDLSCISYIRIIYIYIYILCIL